VVLGEGDDIPARPLQRSYPGKHTALGSSNVTISLVPPVYPHPRLPTRMGQENLDVALQTVPGAGMEPTALPTKMCEEHLSMTLEPPDCSGPLLPTKMGEESLASLPDAPTTDWKAPPRGWHTSQPALNPPPPPLERPEIPPRDPQQLFNRPSKPQVEPEGLLAAAAAGGGVRASYPAARVPGGGAPGGAYGVLASHLSPGTNCVEEEVVSPGQPRRGSYGTIHAQQFGAESAEATHASTRAAAKAAAALRWENAKKKAQQQMGHSSLSTSTLG
jgi:hypothetical protein